MSASFAAMIRPAAPNTSALLVAFLAASAAASLGACQKSAGPLEDVAGFSIAGSSGCAHHGSGRVTCWGENLAGMVPTREQESMPAGDSAPPKRVSPRAQPVAGLEGVKSLVLGRGMAAALHADGSLSRWGYGKGVAAERYGDVRKLSPPPVALSHWGFFEDELCALDADGLLRCEGGLFAPLADLNALTAFHGGAHITSLVGRDGRVRISPRNYRTFEEVPGVEDAVDARFYETSGLVLRRDGTALLLSRSTPGEPWTRVREVSGVAQLHGEDPCVLQADRTLLCGQNFPVDPSLHPVASLPRWGEGISAAVAQLRDVQVGHYVVCGFTGEKRLACAGSNRYGALGRGTLSEKEPLAPVLEAGEGGRKFLGIF